MNLYLRLIKVLLLLPFVKRRGVLDASRISFRVWPNDLDINFHMNNGRYLTLMDLGRVHLLAQIGLLGAVVRLGWQPMLVAAEITYVRAIAPFQRFTLVTRLLTWDDKYFYIEQRFERRGTVCAVAIVKGLLVAKGRKVSTADLLKILGLDVQAPPMPDMLKHWNDLSVLKRAHTEK